MIWLIALAVAGFFAWRGGYWPFNRSYTFQGYKLETYAEGHPAKPVLHSSDPGP